MTGNTEMGETPKTDDYVIDIVDRDNCLAERISEEKKTCLPSSYSCIYRVPSKFLSVNKEMYEPHVISVGPYHRGKETLGATEKYKILYLQSFLGRNAKTSLRDYVKATREIEVQARECYAEEINLSSDEFVRMMVLDGCFLLELVMKYQVEESNMESKDCLFNATWKIPSLRRDMLLLENQIPFLVQDCLYNLSQSPTKAYPLGRLILNFFDPVLPIIQEVNHCRHIGAKHLLDLLHSYLVHQFKLMDFGDNQFWEYTTCETNLEEAGVQLQRKDSGKCLLDINLTKDGKIQMPPFLFGDSWNVLFPNLIALEQCHHNYPDMFTSYVSHMNNFMNSQDDVKLLSDKGIIHCLFNHKLCQEVGVDKLRETRVETGKSGIPSSKIEVHQLVNGFGASMNLEEISRLCSTFDAFRDRVITMKEEGLESLIVKMDLHGNKKMEHRCFWDWIITVKKMMGFGRPSKNVARRFNKRQKY